MTDAVAAPNSDRPWIPSPRARRALALACAASSVGIAAFVAEAVSGTEAQVALGAAQTLAEVPLLLAVAIIALETSDVRPWFACLAACIATWLGGGMRSLDLSSDGFAWPGLVAHLFALACVTFVLVAARRMDAEPPARDEPPAIRAHHDASAGASGGLRVPWWIVVPLVALDAAATALRWTHHDRLAQLPAAVLTLSWVAATIAWMVTKCLTRARLGGFAMASACADALPFAAGLAVAAIASSGVVGGAMSRETSDTLLGVAAGVGILPIAVQAMWLWGLRSRAAVTA